jgi:NAD(P)-dependent dehydrogenase (short-subunit alcohol dehydrogenase family)
VASQLAAHGARVLIASRNKERVEAAVASLREAHPAAEVAGFVLDLAAFSSIDAFVERLNGENVNSLHLLVDNAGVFVPSFSKTEQGFEVQLGTNAVGTIYLTQRLLPLLQAAGSSRVVVLSSEVASQAEVNEAALTDFGGEALTSTSIAQYAQGKLYDALYAIALSRRYKEQGITAFSVHPGFVATEIQGKANMGFLAPLVSLVTWLMACSPRDGALSTLYAATAPGLEGGASFGPDQLNRGFTSPWKPRSKTYTPENAEAMLDAALKLIKAKGGKL